MTSPISLKQTEVVVLCGGRGSRLGSLTTQTPKPLLPVGGEPFLLKLLRNLRGEGFERFFLAAHYLAERFEEFLAAHRTELPSVRLIVEPAPLGTGGALRHAAGKVTSPRFLAVNGDSWVDQRMAPVMEDHLRAGRDGTVVAVRAERVDGSAVRKGLLQLGEGREILGFHTPERAGGGWVNAGSYLFERAAVASWPGGPYSLEADWTALWTGKKVGAYCSEGRLLDIGTPPLYGQAEKILGGRTSG